MIDFTSFFIILRVFWQLSGLRWREGNEPSQMGNQAALSCTCGCLSSLGNCLFLFSLNREYFFHQAIQLAQSHKNEQQIRLLIPLLKIRYCLLVIPWEYLRFQIVFGLVIIILFI